MKGTCGHTTTYSCLVFQIFPMSWENVWQLQSQRRKQPKELFARNIKPHKASVVPWVRFQGRWQALQFCIKMSPFTLLYICRLKKKGVNCCIAASLAANTLKWGGRPVRAKGNGACVPLESRLLQCSASGLCTCGRCLSTCAPTSVTLQRMNEVALRAEDFLCSTSPVMNLSTEHRSNISSPAWRLYWARTCPSRWRRGGIGVQVVFVEVQNRGALSSCRPWGLNPAKRAYTKPVSASWTCILFAFGYCHCTYLFY